VPLERQRAAAEASGADPEAAVSTFSHRLSVILVIALAARISIVIYAGRHPGRFDFPDSHRYVRVAENIAAGRGPIESDDIRTGTDPLFPALLAIAPALGWCERAEIFAWGRALNVLFGSISVLLVALLARQIAGSRAGLIAAAILAIDPILLYFHALVLTETCYVALFLAACCAILRLTAGGSAWWAAAAGMFLGLGAVARSSGLLLAFAMVPFAWHFASRHGRSRRACAAVGLMGLALVAVLAPTVWRNHRLLGSFVPIRTGTGASLLEGLGPWADGGPGMDRIHYPPTPAGADEATRDRIYSRSAFDWAREHPARAMRLAWAKLRRTWSITINAPGYGSGLYSAACWLSVAPQFALAAIGAWWLRRRPATLAFLLAPAVYFSLVHMVFVGSVRYRVPAMPLLFVLSAVALDGFADRVRAARERRAA